MSRATLKQELIETEDEFRHLYEQHQAYKRQLQAIRQKSSIPSQEDEIEIKRIKLRKLELKDRMEVMMREHRRAVATPA